MDVIILAIHLNQFGVEVGAYRGEYAFGVVQNGRREHAAAVFCDEDQMDVQCENAVPASTMGIVIDHRPMYAQCMIERKAATQGRNVPPVSVAQAVRSDGADRRRVPVRVQCGAGTASGLVSPRPKIQLRKPVPRGHRIAGQSGVAQKRRQSEFVCVNCGHTANADTNAAVNILRRANSALKPVEGHRSQRPVEAGPRLRAA